MFQENTSVRTANKLNFYTQKKICKRKIYCGIEEESFLHDLHDYVAISEIVVSDLSLSPILKLTPCIFPNFGPLMIKIEV